MAPPRPIAAPAPAQPASTPKSRGRPKGSGRGRTKITVGFSLDPDVAGYARSLGSAKVNDLLRRSMLRRGMR